MIPWEKDLDFAQQPPKEPPMATNNEYKQTGWDKRKTAYTLGVVIGAIVLATLIVLGFITLQQVEEYTELVIYLVGFLGGLGYLINSALARKNVEPPSPVD